MSCHCKKSLLACVAKLLTSLAAISLGLGYFRQFNIIDWFIQMFPVAWVPTVAAVVYGAIGVAGLLVLIFWFKCMFVRHEECYTDRR